MLADSHGVGKTSLARALSGSIKWDIEGQTDGNVPMEPFNRIQCTVDLLPQDILGYNRFLGSTDQMIFNKGPIFSHFVLCDEINLLTPKTQGSFFQAMEEQAVSIEGQTFALTDPFFIISTMNLKGAHLFPLPAPQLDRFMIQLSMGYPSSESEAAIVAQHGRSDGWKSFGPVVSATDLLRWSALVDDISIHPDIIEYIVACVRRTREHSDVLVGASPRTGVKVSRLARALAMVRGDDYVSVDLVKEIMVPTVAHRLVMKDSSMPTVPVIEQILDTVPVEPGNLSRSNARQ
jgi:MoxR-like ATPase